MDKYFVTIFFIGYAKFAPGTLGSLCGILTFYCLYNFFSVNPMYLFFLISFIFGLGWYFTFTYVHNNKIQTRYGDFTLKIFNDLVGDQKTHCVLQKGDYLDQSSTPVCPTKP